MGQVKNFFHDLVPLNLKGCKNTEETGHEWSTGMISLLCEMNKARKKRMEEGELTFPADERKLLNRMKKYSHNHLLFLHDFNVLFDNNISERDLRKVKNRQKMSGEFRKDSGHEMYCSILTIIETMKRRKMGMFENIKEVIHRYTGYFLAGVKLVGPVGRLNCYNFCAVLV